MARARNDGRGALHRPGRRGGRSTFLGTTAVLPATVLALGGLFVAGALDPLVHGTVALVRAQTQPERLPADRVADWMYDEDVPEWSQMRGVPRAPRVSGPTEPTRPRIAPPERPHRVTFNTPPPMPRVSLQPRDSCMQPHNPVSVAHAFVVTATGGGNVSASWWDMGDPDTQRYEVVAVPDYVNQFDFSRDVPLPQKTFTVVEPVGGCARMTATVTGLTPGARYTFTLMGVNRSALNSKRIYSITRATSETITIR